MERHEPGSPAQLPAPSAPGFKWWDAAVVFFAGLVGANIAASIGYAFTGDSEDALVSALGFVGAYATYAVVLQFYCRKRATGSLRHDLGLALHPGDWWAALLGFGYSIVAGILLLPLSNLTSQRQSVVDELQDASGAKLAVFVIAVLILAPVFEELVFRGMLLRSLRPLMSDNWAIIVSACAFGAVHFLGGNPLGTLIALPALIGLGAISAYLAIRSGDLSRSILLHVGFNLLAVIGTLAR